MAIMKYGVPVVVVSALLSIMKINIYEKCA